MAGTSATAATPDGVTRFRPDSLNAQALSRGAVKRLGQAPLDCQTTSPPTCYTPRDIRAAYGVNQLAAQGLDGRGRTIVIVDAYQSPTLAHDLQTFDRLFGLPNSQLVQLFPNGKTPYNIKDADQVGWAGEITLDVEWAHAIAPGAKIVYVGAKSDTDADLRSALRYAVNRDLGDVLSMSFIEDENCADIHLDQFHKILAQATAEHITLVAGSGDTGAAEFNCPGTSFVTVAGYPTDDPLVTSIGGTDLIANGVTGQYKRESVWNEPDYAGASGGGVSHKFAKPSYQSGLPYAGRSVPDVAWNAAVAQGVLLYWTSSDDLATNGPIYYFGGTSEGGPQWAGLVALADQAHHGRIGAINATLYRLASNRTTYSHYFHDITVGNSTFDGTLLGGGITPGYDAKPGYDLTTGWGSPKASALVLALAGWQPPSHPES
jgi:subtilase family serine protease